MHVAQKYVAILGDHVGVAASGTVTLLTPVVILGLEPRIHSQATTLEMQVSPIGSSKLPDMVPFGALPSWLAVGAWILGSRPRMTAKGEGRCLLGHSRVETRSASNTKS
jgi:hypothetical protein